jgi:RNA polymerase primary sigma factor
MNDLKEFQKRITDMVMVARQQGNKITEKEIRDLFADMGLNDSQFDRIYAYLAASHIDVDGYTQNTAEKEASDQKYVTEESDETGYFIKRMNAEDSAYLKEYYEELREIKKASAQEEIQLMQRLKSGDTAARSRLIEINLENVVEIAKEYQNQGMTMEDMIQEGNMALIQSLEQLSDKQNRDEMKKFIYGWIRKGILESLKEQQENDDFENNVLGKSNLLYAATKKLEEKLGKKANLHELVEYTKMSEEEITDIIGLSADSLELGQEH